MTPIIILSDLQANIDPAEVECTVADAISEWLLEDDQD